MRRLRNWLRTHLPKARDVRGIVPWLIMAGVLALLVAHVFQWDRIRVDEITLVLVGLMLVIPVIEFVRRIKIGDFFEAEISPREVAEVRSRASTELSSTPISQDATSELYSEIIELVKHDPPLGFAKLRIELERLLRGLYESVVPERDTPGGIGLTRMVRELSRRGVVDRGLEPPLLDVIGLANRAIHGESVREQDAEELAKLGINLLAELRFLYAIKIIEPIETRVINQNEVDRYQSS